MQLPAFPSFPPVLDFEEQAGTVMSVLATDFNDSLVLFKFGNDNGTSKNSTENNDKVDHLDGTTLSLLKEMHIETNQADTELAAQMSKCETSITKKPIPTTINDDDARNQLHYLRNVPLKAQAITKRA